MRNDVYEVVVFNDQYGKSVRCRCDIDRQTWFTRVGNGVIKHEIREKNQIRFGYVIASGPKREMTILDDSLKTLMDGLEMQTEAREMFVYINTNFGGFDNFKKLSTSTFHKFRNEVMNYKLPEERVEFLSPSVLRKIRVFRSK